MKSSIPRIIGCDMIENQISYVNKMIDVKYEYNPILVESGVLSAGDWRSLGRRLAFTRPAIGVLSVGDWRSLGQRLAFSTKEINIIVFAFI